MCHNLFFINDFCAITVHFSSNDEDEIDYEEAHRHAIMVKNRLERDEFLQVRMYERIYTYNNVHIS